MELKEDKIYVIGSTLCLDRMTIQLYYKEREPKKLEWGHTIASLVGGPFFGIVIVSIVSWCYLKAKWDHSKIIRILCFIKSCFKQVLLKQIILDSIILTLPLSLFYTDYLSRRDDRSIFEGKKNFFPSTTDWAEYKDLIDAHNKLVKKYDFVVPHICG